MLPLLLISVIAVTLAVAVYWARRRKTTRNSDDLDKALTPEQVDRLIMSECDEKQYSLRRFKE